ncbi:phosphoglycerate kinase, partial [Acinetobacter baumannii]
VPSAAGLLIQKELEVLDRLTENPERPYTVVLGGSKVSDKLGVIEHLLPRVDKLLVGGGMMFTFLAAEGNKVGSSLLEQDQIDTVKGYLA